MAHVEEKPGPTEIGVHEEADDHKEKRQDIKDEIIPVETREDSEEHCSHKLRRSQSWHFAVAFTQQCADEPTLQGWVLQAEDTSTASQSANSVQVGVRNKLLATLMRFILHSISEFRHFIMPLCCALVPTLLKALIVRYQLATYDGTFSGTISDLRFSDGLTTTGRALNLIAVFTEVVGLYGFCVVVGKMWRADLTKGITIKKVLPWLCLYVAVTCFRVFPAFYIGEATGKTSILLNTCFFLQVVFGGGSCLHIASSYGQVTNNPTLKLLVVPIGFFCITIIIYRSFALRMMGSPMGFKVVFVAVINPLLMEMFGVLPCRFVARSLRSNHPSTSFIIVSLAFVGKTVVGRTLTAMIHDPWWLLALCIVASLTEIILRLSVVVRDKLVYGKLFGRFLRNGEDPTAEMNNPHNWLLRAHNSMAETIADLVGIWNGVTTIYSLRVSLDGKTVASWWGPLRSGLIQTSAELSADALSIVLLKMVFKIDILNKVRNRRCHWSIPICFGIMFFYNLVFHVYTGVFLCHTTEVEGAQFIICKP